MYCFPNGARDHNEMKIALNSCFAVRPHIILYSALVQFIYASTEHGDGISFWRDGGCSVMINCNIILYIDEYYKPNNFEIRSCL